MFRCVKKSQIIINPTRIENEEQYEWLNHLLRNSARNMVFELGKAHVAVRYDIDGYIDCEREVVLTHALVRSSKCNAAARHFYHVVGREFNAPGRMIKFESIGMLEPLHLGYMYSHHSKPILCLYLTGKIDFANPIYSHESVFISQSVLMAYQQDGRNYYQENNNTFNIKNHEDEVIEVSFNLQYPLLLRSRNSLPDQIVIEEIGSVIASGSFGCVREVNQTLRPSSSGSLFSSSHRERVLKTEEIKPSQKSNSKNWLRMSLACQEEYQLSKSAKYLRAKRPEFISYNGCEYSYMVMRKLPGRNLMDLINMDCSYVYDPKMRIYNAFINDEWTHVQRIRLSLELLYALKDMHGREHVHRDVKPNNFMVAGSKDCPEVYLLDFGLSAPHATSESGSVMGTPLYIAPEHYAGSSKYTYSSDVFSMAITLRTLWRGFLEDDDDYVLALNIYCGRASGNSKWALNYLCKRKTDGVFTQMQNLDQGVAHDIESVIIAMMRQEVKLRCTLQQAIDRFEDILLNCKMSDMKENAKTQVFSAHGIAASLRERLRPLRDMDYFKCLRQGLKLAAEKVGNNPEAIAEFFDALRERPLYGLTRWSEANARLSDIENDYFGALKSLASVFDRLQDMYSDLGQNKYDEEYRRYLQGLIDKARGRMRTPPEGMVEIIEATHKYRRLTGLITEQLDQVQVCGERAGVPLFRTSGVVGVSGAAELFVRTAVVSAAGEENVRSGHGYGHH